MSGATWTDLRGRPRVGDFMADPVYPIELSLRPLAAFSGFEADSSRPILPLTSAFFHHAAR
jgi:hypothetical protein